MERRRKPGVRIYVAIFLAALLVRLAPGGLYVTPDEPIWVHRSIQFLDALEAWDWARAPQTGHPGVTTMVLGAAGVKIAQILRPVVAAAHLDWIARLAWLAPENAAAFEHLSFFLPAGRAMVAITISLGLVAAYAVGRTCLGERTARWLALLLALDPFFAGHGGLLHTDALQATFVLLAILMACPDRDASRTYRRRRALALALCLALAGLTKTLGLLVAPGLALALLCWQEGGLGRRAGYVAVVAILSLGLLLVLTPTFFAEPRGVVAALLQAVTYHEGIGLRDVFFAGKMRADPGPAFYPVVLAFRLTPPVLLGLLILALKRGQMTRARWTIVGTAALPTLGYLIALTVATKKFDRYSLSAILPLTLVASLTLARLRRAWRNVAVASLLLPWAAVTVLPLHYATPLLGGSRVAQQIVPLGWGEASGLAAGQLNRRLPNPDQATLLTRNIPGTVARFAGTARPYDDRLVGCTDVIIGEADQAIPGYVSWDRVVFGGRQLATLLVSEATLSEQAPPPRVRPLVAPGALPGLSDEAVAPITTTVGLARWLNQRVGDSAGFTYVHAPACYPLSDAQVTQRLGEAQAAGHLVCRPGVSLFGFATSRCELRAALTADPVALARFAGALDIVAATWDADLDRTDPLAVRLRLLPQVALGEVDIYLALETGEGVRTLTWAEGGQRLVNAWSWPAPQWPVGEIADATAYVRIPPDAPPGSYNLIMMLAGTGGWLSMTRDPDTFGGIVLPLGVVEIPPLRGSAPMPNLSPSTDPDWPGVRVLGIVPPEGQVEAGRSLHVALGLERLVAAPPSALSWGLICDGDARQVDRAPWAPSSPGSWPVNARYTSAFALRVDANLPEGVCTVVMWPTSPSTTVPELVDAVPTDALVMGETRVTQRPRQFVLPSEPEHTLSASVGDFAELVGSDTGAVSVQPGMPLTVTLYWRALGPAKMDATAFVHLVDRDGRVWAQSDQGPAGGLAPTVTWRAGEIIVDVHRLSVPEELPVDGTFALYAGLYNADNGAREPIKMGGMSLDDDRVQIGQVLILP